MAAIVKLSNMSTTEANRLFPFQFENDLIEGATITFVTATHTPPSGTAGTCTASFTGTLVYVALDAVTVQTCAACPRYRSPAESVPAVNCSGDRARKKPCCDKCKKKHETHA